jgi:amino acid adenylation domain-containing protein
MSSRVSESSYSPHASRFEPSNLLELLRGRALSRPDLRAYAFLADGESNEVNLTFGELERRARAIGAWLQNAGASGRRVVLLYPPSLEYIAAFFGCLYAGAVAVPVYPPRKNQSLARLQSIVQDSQASVTLTTSRGLLRGAALIDEMSSLKKLLYVATDTLSDELARQWQDPQVCGETLAFLQYTSGSTSEPKGVMVSHANLLHNARMMERACEHTEGATFVSWLPLYHDMGLIGNILQSLYFGATCVLMPPTAFLQRPLRWLHAISHYKAHTSGGPNFAYDLCARRATPEDIADLDLSSWEVAFNGSEPIGSDSLERFAETFASCGFRRESFFPCYGLAEATLFVSGGPKKSAPVIQPVRSSELKHNRVVADAGASGDVRLLVGCGQTLAGQKVVVTNPETLIPCPPDEVGEVWLSGPSVTRGYWNKPEETEQYFRAYHADTGDGPYLRTGDLGFIKDGELFITGRLKDLIIVRGLNHYPQDIELTVEECHPALRPGCGAAFSVELAGEERVVVVQEVVPRHKGLDLPAMGRTIREAVALKHELQLYAVALIAAGSIPKTSSGKIRRRACRALFLEDALDVLNESKLEPGIASGPEFAVSVEAVVTAPPEQRKELLESYLEDCLSRLFRVGRSQLALDLSLSQLGLDSLAAVELSADISEKFGAEISPAELLRGPSIAEVADRILRALAGDEERGGDVERGPLWRLIKPARRDSPLPLSSTQQGLWFLDQLVKGSAFYNIPVAIRLTGPLHLRALEQSLSTIESRHESLRTRFATVAGKPVQVIMPPQTLTPELIELNDADEGDREAELLRLAGRWAGRAFNLSEERLVRVALAQIGENEYVLLILIHHIVADGWSVGVLMRELTELYDAYSQDRLASLPELKIQYADYVMWQRELLESEEMKRQLAYWKRQLGGHLPVLELPSDYPRPAAPSHRGATERFRINQEITKKLKALGQQEGATLFMLMTAALNVLLHRYTGQEDIMVGMPIANRARREFEPLIGCFVNTLALRMTVAGGETFRHLLRTARQVMLDASANQDVPFEKLVEELQPDRSLSHTPIFQVMIASQNSPQRATKMGELTLHQIEVDTGTAKFDLLVFVEEDGQGLKCSFEYSSEIFDGGRISRMAGHLLTLLAAAAADPDRPLSALPLLTPAEEELLLRRWNETTAAASGTQVVHRLFEAQAARTPEAEAVVGVEGRMSYRELNAVANGVARMLRREGVCREEVVGVCVGRGRAMVAGMLGVLKAGGAYVPLDPAYPRERLAFMLEDAGVSVLLSERKLANSLPDHAGKTLFLDEIVESTNLDNDENPDGEVSPENLAYVIYTSGSTGRPKGVALRHAGLANLVNWHRRVYELSPADRATHLAGLEFDASVWELWPYLTAGASIHIPDEETRLSPSRLVEWLTQEAVTICFLPTPLAEAALRETWPSETRLRALLTGGDKLQHRPGESLPFKLFNHYGPTENTVVATAAAVETVAQPWRVPDIGQPISNVRVYLLDPYLQAMPVGVPGELCIGGDGLARGYLRRPELTAEKFIPDPFSDEPGQRLYKTGDLACYLPDGSIEFLGRMDDQVKVRGFRIELAGVEAVLREHEGVREAVVLAREDRLGEKSLVAYVVAARGRVLTDDVLREHLKQRLPEYMIPPVFVTLDKLPLTPNGKVDRKALPAPSRVAPDGSRPTAGSIAEEALAAVWAEVLGGEQPGINDNFFEIGGHSLRAAQVMSRVREVFEVDLPLRSLFESPTVGGLLKLIEQARRDGTGRQAPPLRPAPQDAELPLSFAQERLWFLHRLHPESPAYNISGAVHISGAASPALIRQSIDEIVRRHESLRTTFQTVRGRPVQVVASRLRLSLPLVDLSGLPEAERKREVQRLALEEARRPFDLTRGPLLRGTSILLGGTEQVLLLTIHHIVSDGWSVRIFVRELGALWESFAAGKPSPLAELPIQYADFAYWQRHWLEGETLQTELDFWREQLADAPPALELPTDHARPPVQSLCGGRYLFGLSEAFSKEVRELSRSHGVTTFMTFNTALQVLLQHYMHRDDIVVGADIAERNSTELEGLIGLFVNQLVLRVNAAGVRTFGELLKRVREVTLAAYDHRQVPFHKIVEALKPELDLSRNPLFQVMLVFESDPIFSPPGGLGMTLLQTDAGGSPFDFSLVISEGPDGFKGAFRYSTDLFEATTMAHMAEHFQAILRAVVARPDIELEGLRGILAQSDQELLLKQAKALRETRSRMFRRIRPRTA